jgi:transcriptional regulator with XRE-family HTH domain
MTIEQGSAYIGGSVVNSLAQQKLLSLRQREADAHWNAVAEERKNAETSKKRRAARLSDMSKVAKQDFKQQEKMQLARIRDEAIMQFVSLNGIETNWKPGSDVPPPNPKSQEEFAKQAGIAPGHYKEIEAGTVEITLDDAVKISRAFHIDIATFLLPDVENLEKSKYFDLHPIHPVHGPIYMYEWVMWILGYRPLPGQDKKIWRKTTSMPAAFIYNVHGGRPRDIDEVNRELDRIANSSVSAYRVLDVKTPRRDTGVPHTPFQSLTAPQNFTLKQSQALIKSSLGVATRLKVAFETGNSSKALKTKRDQFSDSIGIIRDGIVKAVLILLALGRD